MNVPSPPASGAEELDAPHQTFIVGDMPLERGGAILDCMLTYVTHGTLNRQRNNAVLVLPSIGGTHHRHDFLIGPGRALDPCRYFIVAVDALGNGLSSSPSNSRRQPGSEFPVFNVRDLIFSQHGLMSSLSINRWHAVCGASFGGMQALQWAVTHPDKIDFVVALTPMARAHAWSITVNEATRLALYSDPAWDGKDFLRQPERGWRVWAALMRCLATQTPAALAHAHPRPSDVVGTISRFAESAAETPMHPWDWIRQTQAYDAHDLGETPGFGGSLAAALGAIRARCLVAIPHLDLYTPVDEARVIAQAVASCELVEIPSIQGHLAASSADAQAASYLNMKIAAFLNDPSSLQKTSREDVLC